MIYLIETESGLSIIEYKNFPHSKDFEGFFQVINEIIDDIRSNIQENRTLSDFSRIMMYDEFSFVFHYYSKGKILLCSLADVDDNKEKILEVLKTLARRFWQKHNLDLEKFKVTNQQELFNSFYTDIQIFTRNGNIAEDFPKLIVNDSTLNRLKKMEMISLEELSIARICRGTLSPLQISEKTDIEHELVTKILKKLKTLDIVKSPLVELSK